MSETTAAELPEVGSVVEPVEPAARQRQGTSDRQARAAAWIFAAYIVIAAWALIARLGNYYWFQGDEWHFLVRRDAGDLIDLLHPHNEHVVALPILVYRALWHLFGLRSYTPYQIPVITLHLTAAVLLRAVMRRSGVNPWIATAAASVFVLFGSGEENIIWAFQIGFTGALVFGLAQLLTADHDGPFGGRDWLALGFGLLGLLSAGFTPITAAVVGAVVLVKRDWRAAAFQTVPLGILYGTWWAFIGPDRISDPYGRSSDWGQILYFVKTGLVATFEGMAGGRPLVAALYALALPVGLALAWAPLRRGERLQQAIMPLSLLLAGLAFLLISGYGRWWIYSGVGASPRYVHLVAAFTLPALAVAADGFARHWRPAVVITSVLFVSTVPYGISQFDTNLPLSGPYFRGRRELIAALARSPYVTQVPRSTRPDALWSPITAGWLLDALKAGKLPDLERPGDANNPTFRLRFGLAPIDEPSPSNNCKVERGPVDVSLKKGDELGVKVGPWTKPKDAWYFKQSYTIQLLDDGRPVGEPIPLHPLLGQLLRAQFDLDVRFDRFPGTETYILCR